MKSSLSIRDRAVVWHPYTQDKIAPLCLPIVRGDGSYIYTSDGQKLFDGISSWWTNAHGHCNPYIKEAINKQLDKLEHVIFASFTHEPAVVLAEKLLEIVPKNLSRVFYSDNGSSAVEIALKMAYQYWQHQKQDRSLFIALEYGYHGDTFGAMSVSERGTFTKPFWPLLFDVIKVKSPCVSEINLQMTASDLTNKYLADLKTVFIKYEGKMAGFIVEPMLQAASGMRIFTSGFLSGIRKLCDEYNTLLIADEVATGFYRTNKCFALDHENVLPDIMCLAKCLTGGFLPLAVTLASENIYQAFLSDSKADALLHGHSFTANALACASAVASLELFALKETREAINAIAHITSLRAKELASPYIKNIRVIGTIIIIELHDDHSGYLSSIGQKIYDYCLSHGLFIRPLGHIIYLMPPYSSSVKEISWAIDIIAQAIDIYGIGHKAPCDGDG